MLVQWNFQSGQENLRQVLDHGLVTEIGERGFLVRQNRWGRTQVFVVRMIICLADTLP